MPYPSVLLAQPLCKLLWLFFSSFFIFSRHRMHVLVKPATSTPYLPIAPPPHIPEESQMTRWWTLVSCPQFHVPLNLPFLHHFELAVRNMRSTPMAGRNKSLNIWVVWALVTQRLAFVWTHMSIKNVVTTGFQKRGNYNLSGCDTRTRFRFWSVGAKQFMVSGGKMRV